MCTLGERIKTLRENKQMTQQNLGDIVKLHGSNIGRIEKGKVFPTSDVLLDIAICFGVSCDWLLTGKDSEIKFCDNADEISLIQSYRRLNPEDKNDIHELIEFKLYRAEKEKDTTVKSSKPIDSQSGDMVS